MFNLAYKFSLYINEDNLFYVQVQAIYSVAVRLAVLSGAHILINLGGGGELDCGTDFPNSDIQI